MTDNDKIKTAIEEHLLKKLDEDLSQEEIGLLEMKVNTIRKLQS